MLLNSPYLTNCKLKVVFLHGSLTKSLSLAAELAKMLSALTLQKSQTEFPLESFAGLVVHTGIMKLVCLY